jgi:hypothetical protein
MIIIFGTFDECTITWIFFAVRLTYATVNIGITIVQVHLQRSDDMGKTFSGPVRINNIQGEVQLDAQWSAPALGVGPNSEVYVVWYNADYSDFKRTL